MTLNHYYQNEFNILQADLNRINKASLIERKDALKDFLEAVASKPDFFLQSCAWAIDGTYGAGACHQIEKVIHTKQVNINALVFNLTAQLEYLITDKDLSDAWHGLDADLQTRINEAITNLIMERRKLIQE